MTNKELPDPEPQLTEGQRLAKEIRACREALKHLEGYSFKSGVYIERLESIAKKVEEL